MIASDTNATLVKGTTSVLAMFSEVEEGAVPSNRQAETQVAVEKPRPDQHSNVDARTPVGECTQTAHDSASVAAKPGTKAPQSETKESSLLQRKDSDKSELPVARRRHQNKKSWSRSQSPKAGSLVLQSDGCTRSRSDRQKECHRVKKRNHGLGKRDRSSTPPSSVDDHRMRHSRRGTARPQSKKWSSCHTSDSELPSSELRIRKRLREKRLHRRDPSESSSTRSRRRGGKHKKVRH